MPGPRDEDALARRADDATATRRLSDDVRARRRHVLRGMLQLTHMLNESIRAANDSEIVANRDILTLLTIHLEGPQRPREITAATGLTRGGTTDLIDRLERNGLVQRLRAPDDRRGLLVTLTDGGATAAERAGAACARVLNFAAPLIESWRQHFEECGCELGPWRAPRGGRQAIEQVRRLAAAGTTIGPAYRSAFGTGDPSPFLTLHALLLATESGGTRPTAMCDAMGLTSASASDLLDRMEGDGLVARISGAHPDGRVTVVTATERGRAALDTLLDMSDETMVAFAEVFFPAVSSR